MKRENKTPIDKMQERFAEQRGKVVLEFSRTEKIGEYRVKTREIRMIFKRECPIELEHKISGLDSLRNLTERLRNTARLQHRELIIIDKDSNTEHKSFAEINNMIENCHDKQRINATNKRIRANFNKRTVRCSKPKKIDIRIYENRM